MEEYFASHFYINKTAEHAVAKVKLRLHEISSNTTHELNTESYRNIGKHQ